MHLYIYGYVYWYVYHDNESGTLVQLVFKEGERERMNGITLDEVTGSMCVRRNKRENKCKKNYWIKEEEREREK